MSTQHWIFGYGSLIYKVDFPYVERQTALLCGWSRRFWQGSQDHRGTPDAPGRVVTLIREPKARCRGVAYLVNESVFEHLDHREKNGYERHQTQLLLEESDATVSGTFYIATSDNPAFLGDGSDQHLAQHIANSAGPSGSNADYLLSLANALRNIGEHDDHVMRLEHALLSLSK